jgi:SulP family sulfate permease
MPVQPLKATSALAMAIGASASTIAVVCFFMTGALFIIRFLHLDILIARLFTRPIIRGIQLGLAFILIKSGLKLIFNLSSYNIYSNGANSLDLFQAFFLLFLPQLPLTLANSIYATADTSKTYFKDKANRVTPRALLVSLGLANLLSGLAGGIPLCHGSSGVTAHYRFGARSGFCGVLAGLVFMLIALACAFGAGILIRLIPFSLLGLSLIYIGIRHAALIKDIVSIPREFMIAVIIGLYSVISDNLALAFGLGIVVNFATYSTMMYGRWLCAIRRR